jgi:uncharacterized membrane protein YgaE (UPF0421/DUF939 family)
MDPGARNLFVGSVVSAVYLSVLPFSAIGMAASIFATVPLCHTARIPDHVRPAALTVAIIMVLSSLSSTLTPILNATLRFGESGIGTANALIVVLVWPEPRLLEEP